MTGQAKDNAFQQYTAAPALAVAKLPSSLSFTDASVLPLALSTASAGLYPSSNLGLPHPQASSPKKSGKTILIWGGASSVGSTAIQLAVASGVTVITTASQRNHQYVKDLGATTVVDYNSSSAVQEILDAIKSAGGEFAGVYDSISEAASYKPVFEIVQKAGGSNKVITVLPPPEDKPSGVETINIFAPIIFTPDQQDTGKAVWQDFVGPALENGSLRALPKAEVVGKGLGDLQKAMDVQKKGVSAKKIVVEL
ncbi:NAD(P)-binding protein [Myriangium duriaei CBS 260.36]|uniref:NAD(P)-binding protein n=1 Tax=Myriangium duriaei CBS 260.36 TaxID=1168546 RepID=A0A9P4J3T5_9PEZI|nr:NAD(P)-binding protein [Myriangium duriaei CBS 260.36]